MWGTREKILILTAFSDSFMKELVVMICVRLNSDILYTSLAQLNVLNYTGIKHCHRIYQIYSIICGAFPLVPLAV